LKELGVEIHIIFIPSGAAIACPAYLKSLASTPVDAHYFPVMEAPYYDQLNKAEFLNYLVEKSCLEITR